MPKGIMDGPAKTRMVRLRVDPQLHSDMRWASQQRGSEVSEWLRRMAVADIEKLKKKKRR